MIMGPKVQKGMLIGAAIFAWASTLYALVMSIIAYRVTGTLHIFLAWCVLVAVGIPLMWRMYRYAWKLIDLVNRD